MLEQILQHERDAFLLLNGSDSLFFDRFMWLYSGKAAWIPLAVFIICIITYKKKWKESILVLLGIVLVITLCDQFASHLCKPVFTRFRPTHHPDFIEHVKIVFDYRGGKYGFISSHAANAFGFATFMSLLMRNKLFSVTIFLWAILMAYTRIYLGVHFISDIVPGAMMGTFFGYVGYWLFIKSYKIINKNSIAIQGNSCYLYANQIKHLIAAGIIINILVLLAFNTQLITLLG